MIETRALKKKFGAQTILDGVSLCIETGESAAIIGRSGGGKSVLLKHIIGLLQQFHLLGSHFTQYPDRQTGTGERMTL